MRELQERGYPAFLIAKNGLYYVRAGAFRNLENAIAQERKLRQQGFATFIVRT
ncbi:MAG: SPOR domain-containing protein [Lachnospiraceae bacterium]|nr:SPOR domain-containing protein [Lachnospiraceae bacterium]